MAYQTASKISWRKIEHDDIRDDAVDALGGYPSFEETCKPFGCNVEKTILEEFDLPNELVEPHRNTVDFGKDHIVNRDVAVLGERYLDLLDVGATDTVTFSNIRAAMDHYAVTDIEPLFELADRRPFHADE